MLHFRFFIIMLVISPYIINLHSTLLKEVLGDGIFHVIQRDILFFSGSWKHARKSSVHGGHETCISLLFDYLSIYLCLIYSFVELLSLVKSRQKHTPCKNLLLRPGFTDQAKGLHLKFRRENKNAGAQPRQNHWPGKKS